MKTSNGFARGTSLFLAFCMVAALLVFHPGPVSAAEDVKPTLSVKYLGNGSAPDFAVTATGPAFSSIDDEETVFWIGLSVDKLNQVPLVRDEGVYGMEIGFDYNPALIEPVGYGSDNSVSASEQDWLTTLNRVNMAATADGIHWDSSRYSITEDSNWKAVGYQDSQREEALPSDWKTAFISIQKNTADSAATSRFYQTGSAEEEYLLCLPFRLKKLPENGQAPPALKLARGSDTLVFMTGADGASGGSWEKDVTHNPDTNLKNIFDFGGDLQLFEGTTEPAVEHQLADLTVTQTDGTASGQPSSLYETSALTTPSAFDSTIVDYYLSLAKGTTEVELNLTTSGTAVAPKVEFSTGGAFTAITVSAVENGSYTADVAGLLGNSDKTVFPNTIKITMANEECYTLKLRVPQDGGGEPGEARIVLNYGNSPYGEIMKKVQSGELTTEEGITAKEKFDQTLVYDGVTKGMKYYTEAWDSYSTFDNGKPYNGDRDETAIFVYQRKAFRDPGFTAYYSDGTEVKPEDVTITFSAISYAGQDIPRYADTDRPRLVEASSQGDGKGNLFDSFISYNIRPDVYDIHYSFLEKESGERITAIRRMIVVSRVGDALINTSNTVNNVDASTIVANVTYFTRNGNSVYKFRIVDANRDSSMTINNVDAAMIMVGVVDESVLGKFYNDLPSN